MNDDLLVAWEGEGMEGALTCCVPHRLVYSDDVAFFWVTGKTINCTLDEYSVRARHSMRRPHSVLRVATALLNPPNSKCHRASAQSGELCSAPVPKPHKIVTPLRSSEHQPTYSTKARHESHCPKTVSPTYHSTAHSPLSLCCVCLLACLKLS